MKNTRMMYFRSGNLWKEFILEHNMQMVTSTGRVANQHIGNGTKTLKGCLAEASKEDRTNHSQKEHIVTHTIVQAGKPKANRTDRLILGNRVFYIVDMDDVGRFGISTIYYAEERQDLK